MKNLQHLSFGCEEETKQKQNSTWVAMALSVCARLGEAQKAQRQLKNNVCQLAENCISL